MPHRVREILLVSSAYDAFVLEEDGRLTERLFLEYSELNLPSAPRITHAVDPAEAMEQFRRRRCDLLMTTSHGDDRSNVWLARTLKQLNPGLPAVELLFDESEPSWSSAPVREGAFDFRFLWTGDARSLLAIVKLVEDSKNADHDVSEAGVYAIIVVEDSIRRYSSFLALLYTELMRQSQSLIAEGLNPLHKLLRMRSRPKILLATSYESALSIYGQYAENVLALISDVRFPRSGRLDSQAGFELVRWVRRNAPELPILLQSSEPVDELTLLGLNAHFVDKNSPRILHTIKEFLLENLGFGDFVFRLPDGREVARASDMYELQQTLSSVPLESVRFHASRNHFSAWLRARCMFGLAQYLRGISIDEFGSIQQLRDHLLDAIRQAGHDERDGVIIDFSLKRSGPENQFVRLRGGSIGGKARSIAFIHSQLVRSNLPSRFPDLAIKIPQTLVLGTDAYDQFLDCNPALVETHPGRSRSERLEAFLNARLPEPVRQDLWESIRSMKFDGPLAVRSSSLLEDSARQPCAGLYETFMLPNLDPDPHERFTKLLTAIKAVYASVFSPAAREYFAGMPQSIEEEKMAVIIQELVGQTHGSRFYPHFSGVALSHNHYAMPPQKPEDGVMLLALGLGEHIVRGGSAIRVSPRLPRHLPQQSSPREFARFSQRDFVALDLNHPADDSWLETHAFLSRYSLQDAEQDGTLQAVGSVYDPHDDRLVDHLRTAGSRVVSFNNVLKWESIPLAAAMAEILELLESGLNTGVEIEFVVDLGSPVNEKGEDSLSAGPTLYLLQARPLAQHFPRVEIDSTIRSSDRVVCKSVQSLGHGVFEQARDIIYVSSLHPKSEQLSGIVRAISHFNSTLSTAQQPYLLIGPGRWGTSDPALGIPVEWRNISGACVIVEAGFPDRDVEPSQGSHFFHNLISRGLGYLCVPGRDSATESGEAFLDHSWLKGLESESTHELVRHIRLPAPLSILLDGRKSKGIIVWRQEPEPARSEEIR